MHKLEQKVEKLEEGLAPEEKKQKQYIVVCERLTPEEWNDSIKNPDKWIWAMPDEEPEGYILKLKKVRLP
jgi:hypothetical protein